MTLNIIFSVVVTLYSCLFHHFLHASTFSLEQIGITLELTRASMNILYECKGRLTVAQGRKEGRGKSYERKEGMEGGEEGYTWVC